MALLIAAALFTAWLAFGLHRNEVNWGSWWTNAIDGWVRWFARWYHRLDGDRIELPEQGGVLLAANHLSGLDPFLLISMSNRPLRFLIAEEEYNRFGLRWLFRAAGCIPVDRGGRTDAAFRSAVRALRNGEVIALFPHGRIYLDDQPESRVKPGVLRLAQLSRCPIVPVRLQGVKGIGTVVSSVFLRSRANVKVMPMIDAEITEHHDMRQQLGELLLGRRLEISLE